MMSLQALRPLLLALALAPVAAPAGAQSDADAARAAIAAAVIERLGPASRVDVEILQAPATLPAAVTADPAPGARLGTPSRFVLTPMRGARVTVVARVTAEVGHAVATRALARDAELTSDDVEWREARLDGVLIEPLPALDDVLAARPRRAMADGETFVRSLLARPYAVRAGDTVTMTVRSGAIEARGVGRAVNSGFVGDVIRILRPGSREPSRARITAPAAVEILR